VSIAASSAPPASLVPVPKVVYSSELKMLVADGVDAAADLPTMQKNGQLCALNDKFEWALRFKGKWFCSACIYFASVSKKTKPTDFSKPGGAEAKRLNESLTNHSYCDSHRLAMKHLEVLVSGSAIKSGLAKAMDGAVAACMTALKTAFWTLRRGKPLLSYGDNLDFAEVMGSEHNPAMYREDNAAREMCGFISDVLVEDVTADLAAADYIAVLSDESTDINTDKVLLQYVYSIKDLKVKTAYLMTTDLEADAGAENITRAIVEALAKHGIPTFEKVVVMTCDGCRTNMGRHAGVGVRLARLGPFIIVFWCSPHRLQLAVQDTADGLTGGAKAMFENVELGVKSIYNYFKRDHKR
jgi:hypothetical protein